MVAQAHDAFIARLHHLEVGEGCPVFIAAASLIPDRWGRRRVVSGRGLTRLEAEARCLAEAHERHAAIFDRSAALLRATTAELGADAVSPSALLLISELQFRQADAWNRLVDADHQLPGKCPDDRPINWVAGRSLLSGKATYLPAAHCFLGYPTAMAEGFPVPDSSGLASGDTRDGAVERSILEVIERDAVSVWWYGRVRRPAIRLEHGEVPFWSAFAAWMRACGRQFWILDLTHDLEVPVAAAVACDSEGSNFAFGFAAARTREHAAIAAMGELVQFELTKRLQAQQGATPQRGFLSWCRRASLAENDFLHPDESAAVMHARPITGWTDYVERLRRRCLSTYVLHFPTADPLVHVTRAVVPGLRSLWPRFAPGRLYDVAFDLGWQDRRINEGELNPVAMLY